MILVSNDVVLYTFCISERVGENGICESNAVGGFERRSNREGAADRTCDRHLISCGVISERKCMSALSNSCGGSIFVHGDGLGRGAADSSCQRAHHTGVSVIGSAGDSDSANVVANDIRVCSGDTFDVELIGALDSHLSVIVVRSDAGDRDVVRGHSEAHGMTGYGAGAGYICACESLDTGRPTHIIEVKVDSSARCEAEYICFHTVHGYIVASQSRVITNRDEIIFSKLSLEHIVEVSYAEGIVGRYRYARLIISSAVMSSRDLNERPVSAAVDRHIDTLNRVSGGRSRGQGKLVAEADRAA